MAGQIEDSLIPWSERTLSPSPPGSWLPSVTRTLHHSAPAPSNREQRLAKTATHQTIRISSGQAAGLRWRYPYPGGRAFARRSEGWYAEESPSGWHCMSPRRVGQFLGFAGTEV